MDIGEQGVKSIEAQLRVNSLKQSPNIHLAMWFRETSSNTKQGSHHITISTSTLKCPEYLQHHELPTASPTNLCERRRVPNPDAHSAGSHHKACFFHVHQWIRLRSLVLHFCFNAHSSSLRVCSRSCPPYHAQHHCHLLLGFAAGESQGQLEVTGSWQTSSDCSTNTRIAASAFRSTCVSRSCVAVHGLLRSSPWLRI